MKHLTIKYGICAAAWLAVLYPLFVRFQHVSWAPGQSWTALVFPFLGLLMTSLLWLHAISGAFEPWLQKYISFDWFVRVTAAIILWCLLLHPLLLLISLNFSISDIYAYYGVTFIWVGALSWLLLITYDIIKPLKKKYDFFAKHWNTVLIISNIGFLLSFFHSLKLGSDLQANPLRLVWIFYGITAALAIFYTYAIKPYFATK